MSTDVAAPAEGRALTRLNWLTRQLVDSPDQLRLDAFVHLARSSTSELDSVLASVDGFYEVVTQRIRSWQAKAPQLPKEGSAVEAAGIDLTINEPATEFSKSIDTLEEDAAALVTPESDDDQDFVTPEGEDESLVSWESQHEQLAEEREQVGTAIEPAPFTE